MFIILSSVWPYHNLVMKISGNLARDCLHREAGTSGILQRVRTSLRAPWASNHSHFRLLGATTSKLRDFTIESLNSIEPVLSLPDGIDGIMRRELRNTSQSRRFKKLLNER